MSSHSYATLDNSLSSLILFSHVQGLGRVHLAMISNTGS